MYMKKATFDEIKERYSALLVVNGDVGDAFNFVRDVLEAEAEAVSNKCSYATASVNRMKNNSYDLFTLLGEIDDDIFDEANHND